MIVVLLYNWIIMLVLYASSEQNGIRRMLILIAIQIILSKTEQVHLSSSSTTTNACISSIACTARICTSSYEWLIWYHWLPHVSCWYRIFFWTMQIIAFGFVVMVTYCFIKHVITDNYYFLFFVFCIHYTSCLLAHIMTLCYQCVIISHYDVLCWFLECKSLFRVFVGRLQPMSTLVIKWHDVVRHHW